MLLPGGAGAAAVARFLSLTGVLQVAQLFTASPALLPVTRVNMHSFHLMNMHVIQSGSLTEDPAGNLSLTQTLHPRQEPAEQLVIAMREVWQLCVPLF